MHTVNVRIDSCAYPIYIGRGVLGKFRELAKKFSIRGNVLVASQRRILRLHGPRLAAVLKASGIRFLVHELPEGEPAKSEKELFRLYGAMLKARLARSSCVIALGGGVVGDLAGYAASTFKRGIGLIHIPTTLLAQVDSSIGGKTAINLKAGKNLVGTFYHPKLILSDMNFLATLSREVISDSLAEVVKYGMIAGERLFSWLEKNMARALQKDLRILEKIVLECSKIKARVVEFDPSETRGFREILNYGHTFGHAFEARGAYQGLTHGKAVACGMAAAGKLAQALGLVKSESLARQEKLIESAELSVSLKGLGYTPREIMRYFQVDKKVEGGQVKFILPQGIGKLLVVKGISPSLVEETLKQLL